MMFDLRSVDRRRPWIIGHRGASGDAPENTLAAFRLALEQGADLLETDVQLTADGVPVIIHDPTLDRTTSGHGLVAHTPFADIRTLDAGSWFSAAYAGERILTLDELLEWVSGRVPVAIEIKNGPIYYPGIEGLVVDAIRRHKMVHSSIVISFDHRAALRVRQLCPELVAGVLFACAPLAPASLALEAQAQALLPHWSNLTTEMVEDAHSRSLAVCPWCVDEELEMRWVLDMGVDAIATNYPARLAALLAKTHRGG